MIYIPDGATIEIFNKIKEGYNIKHLYYYYLLERYKNSSIIYLIFSFNTKKFAIRFPSYISISQMIKAVKLEFKLDDNTPFFL